MSGLSPVPVTRPAYLAESPVWDEASQTLLWVDIMAGDVHRFDPAGGEDTLTHVDVPVGAVSARHGGGLVVAAGTGFATLDEQTGELDWLWEGGLGDRMNDGKSDPAGRFLGGTLTYARDPGGCALYRLAPDGQVTVVLEDVTLSNGLGWSPAGDLFYYADTPTERVDVMLYEPATGEVAARRVFADLHEVTGRPDGLTVDSEGGIWIAMAGGGAVRRYTADGQPDLVIEFPVRAVTSVTFGGADLGDLYVTTSREHLTEADLASQPLSGSVFVVSGTGFTGLPANTFAG
jgi:sugar lactone lactonase YvrE